MLEKEIWEIVDGFCGFGGTSEGFASHPKAKVIAAINHDPVAIASHQMNHPEAKHYVEDIALLDPRKIGKADVMWFSCECTHFSWAKGGGSRDADSRTQAEQVERYAEVLDPGYIWLENVKEFLGWGPLKQKVDKQGNLVFKPDGTPFMIPDTDADKLGSYYKAWVKRLKEMGYVNYRYKLLNAADFGAYTSRERYFGIFAKEGLPIRFPSPTHSRHGAKAGLKPWNAVREKLDFTDKGNSIFGRKKPLSEKTLERIYAGLRKYVAKGDGAYVIKWLGNNQKSGINSGKSIHEPLPTITCQNRLGVVQTEHFITKYFSGDPRYRNASVDAPCPTILTKPQLALVEAEPFLVQRNGGNPSSKIVSVNGPARTLTATGGNQDLVQTEGFLAKYYGSGGQVSSINEPCGTLTTKDRMAFIQADYSSNGKPNSHSSVNEPLGTITTTPKHRLVSPEPFILKSDFNNGPVSVNKPCPTLTASRHHLNMVQAIRGKLHPVEADSPAMKKILTLMEQEGFSDVRMRMLRVDELLQIQGFPKDYQMKGNQTQRKKFIGNSVVPLMSYLLFDVNYRACKEREAALVAA